MDATVSARYRDISVKPSRWRRVLSVAARRTNFMPWVELGTLAVAITIAIASYFLVSAEPGGDQKLLAPGLVALLMVANLVPGVALLVLIGRRVAKKRAARSPMGGGGRLHVRLVAIFSVIASVPMLVVVIFASLLFQYGVEFWFSDRARSMLENASLIAEQTYQREVDRVANETVTMASDLRFYLNEMPIDSPVFGEGFGRQVLNRNLSEAIILSATKERGIQAFALVNPYDRPLDKIISPKMIAEFEKDPQRVVIPVNGTDRIGALTRMAIGPNTYLYASRVFEPEMAANVKRGEAVLADYKALLGRSRALQLQFNLALLIISLLIVGAAVWIALQVADRLVRPVGDLVGAAQRISGGDLSARVETPLKQDELGRLANAFNRMARTLEEQTGALESRRAFIEAVLTGVTAGVISVDPQRRVRLINSSAAAMLRAEGGAPIGQMLGDLAPELDALVGTGDRNEIVQLGTGGEPRTLAVKVVCDDSGHVLTFDDITQQVLDQRRAAWSDVARRIAHEIKNPLTPIQLAAERLQRRYGKQIVDDPSTFTRLTETIVRQVGDLRRMVDEFSSFARMPKPLFRHESLTDIARQALFLHEVAHPEIAFALDQEEDMVTLVCDRRQLGQALTNLVKNAVEAVQQKQEEAEAPCAPGQVMLSIRHHRDRLVVSVADNGIGLPAERERLLEPYVTTRSRGTGLGLAIVQKIVEEHFGTMQLADNPGGGTIMAMSFDPQMLERVANDDADADDPEGERAPKTLTRKRNG